VSRIGKHPVAIPSGVEVVIADQLVSVKGKLGTLEASLPEEVEVSRDDGQIVVKPRGDSGRERSMWGMSRTLVNNMVVGVSEGFKQNLEITGVGYRAQVEGKVLTLQLGFSHDIKMAIPDDLSVRCERPTAVEISGPDAQRVGQFAAEIRRFRPPEPYKGKGVRYANETIRRKEGKKK
tara:strand:+ start:4400 stop:4933 length:534 start_codon:yes stop_codon:yes gene_type:complete